MADVHTRPISDVTQTRQLSTPRIAWLLRHENWDVLSELYLFWSGCKAWNFAADLFAKVIRMGQGED